MTSDSNHPTIRGKRFNSLHLLGPSVLVLGLWIGAPSAAEAQLSCLLFPRAPECQPEPIQPEPIQPEPTAVPELNPAEGTGALALLAGAMMVALGRRKRNLHP